MARQRKRNAGSFPTFCCEIRPRSGEHRPAGPGSRRAGGMKRLRHGTEKISLLQLALERFDLVGERRHPWRPAPRSCARRAAPWCGRVRRTGGRFPAGDRSVSVLARYIATWRGRTTFAVRRDDSRSERLTLYCRATTRWMSSILTRLGSCGRIRSRTSRSAISSVTGWPLSLLCASRRLIAPSRSRPLWVMVRAR